MFPIQNNINCIDYKLHKKCKELSILKERLHNINPYSFFIESATGVSGPTLYGPFEITDKEKVRFFSTNANIITTEGSVLLDLSNITPKGVTGSIGPTGTLPVDIINQLPINGTFYSDYLYWSPIDNDWKVGSQNVHIGCDAGKTSQSTSNVAVGYNAGATGQASDATAIGHNAGFDKQSTRGVYIGNSAGKNSAVLDSETSVVGIGSHARETTGRGIGGVGGVVVGHNAYLFDNNSLLERVSDKCVAIGSKTFNNPYEFWQVVLGYNAGHDSNFGETIAIGHNAGETKQSNRGVAIGHDAGKNTQGLNMSFATQPVAIGVSAGQDYQDEDTIAIGHNAGKFNQEDLSIAIGHGACETGNLLVDPTIPNNTTLFPNAVVNGIGYYAGANGQATGASAIGAEAGLNGQAQYTFILNATGTPLNGVPGQTNSFYIKPIREVPSDVEGLQKLYYFNPSNLSANNISGVLYNFNIRSGLYNPVYNSSNGTIGGLQISFKIIDKILQINGKIQAVLPPIVANDAFFQMSFPPGITANTSATYSENLIGFGITADTLNNSVVGINSILTATDIKWTYKRTDYLPFTGGVDATLLKFSISLNIS